MAQNRAESLQTLPAPSQNQVYVKVAALNGGFLTLPERAFVTDADPQKGITAPSMCFLIEHPNKGAQKSDRLVFDLGIKRDLTQYKQPATQEHIKTRQPFYCSPDARSSLLNGGLDPAKDIDYVILSHVHYDHVGTPSDYPDSIFVLGSGTLYIMEHGAPFYPIERMEKNQVPSDQVIELPPIPESDRKHMAGPNVSDHKWESMATFSHTVDYFKDGSLYIIDAPGHLHGHINVLMRVGPSKWVYLGGDCCHDRRIVLGEKEIAVHVDEQGKRKCAHAELPLAKKTIQNIQRMIKANGDNVEWVVAHDWEWASANQHRFFPGWMY